VLLCVLSVFSMLACGSGRVSGRAGSSVSSTGSGASSGMPLGSNSGAGAGTGATSGAPSGAGGSTPARVGVCPSGFVVCDGVCLDASLMGPDCRPALCPAPPAGTTAPTRAAGITSRGFNWSVVLDATGTTTVTFKPGPVGGGLSATLGADLYYRVNGVPALQMATLTSTGAGAFTWTTEAFQKGDDLDFYFHQTVGNQTIITGSAAPPPTEPLIDTMWFHQTIGAAADPEPAYPLNVSLAGRFRDRHPNEERFDHFVDTYFEGPIFSLDLVDHGDSLDVTIVPLDTHVYGVDFKHYECFGNGMSGGLPAPTPLCFTPPGLSAAGVRINPTNATATSSGTYTTSVTNLSYGQLLDFELTFVRQPGPMDNRTYYTEFFEYYIGSGRLQPHAQHPWAHAAGDESVTDVTMDQFGYAQHIPNITLTELTDFISGKVLFEANFDSHVGYNPPTTFDCPRGLTPGTMVPALSDTPPVSPLFAAGTSFTDLALATVARPGYTASACFSCHHLDGKGPPAGATLPDQSGLADNGMGASLLKLFSASADDQSAGPDPIYGAILDQSAPAGGTPEAKASVTWQTVAGQFADGTPYSLRKPVLSTGTLRDGPLAATTHVSMRIPRPVFGLGFLEAVPEETILAFADPDDANGDGISGRPNYVIDPTTNAPALGRFGWKAGTSSLREQAALAFVNDMGLTSPLYPQHRCGKTQLACLNAVNDATPELASSDLDHLQSYLRGLSVPPRRNYDDPTAAKGQGLFFNIGCSKCHVPNLVTSSTYAIAEMQNLNIQPFTDLLLHDMGPNLADDAPIEEGTATGSEWRTCPLWGNGTGPSVMYQAIDAFDPNGDAPTGAVYLHDGRARSITEAILWHGGEAQGARDLFVKMTADQRQALLAFVAYPFADPVPIRHCATSTPSTPSTPTQ
jgi:CxxC motif-containing protein (DUF1111 family)